MTRSIITAFALAIGSSLGLAEEQQSTQSQTSASTSSVIQQHQQQDLRLFDSSLIENKRVMDQDGKNMGKLERLDPQFDAVIPPTAPIERLAEGYDWSEGPVWVRAGG